MMSVNVPQTKPKRKSGFCPPSLPAFQLQAHPAPFAAWTCREGPQAFLGPHLGAHSKLAVCRLPQHHICLQETPILAAERVREGLFQAEKHMGVPQNRGASKTACFRLVPLEDHPTHPNALPNFEEVWYSAPSNSLRTSINS